jgi:hypothetical protein
MEKREISVPTRSWISLLWLFIPRHMQYSDCCTPHLEQTFVKSWNKLSIVISLWDTRSLCYFCNVKHAVRDEFCVFTCCSKRNEVWVCLLQVPSCVHAWRQIPAGTRLRSERYEFLRGSIFIQIQHDLEPKTKLNSIVWVWERTIPTERTPLVDEVIANLCV